MQTKKKKILVCPLDWGLGHATRCIPIINSLRALECEVIIAASGNPLSLLKQEFPAIEFIDLPGFQVNYSKGKNQTLKLLEQLPSFSLSIYKEHQELKSIIKEHNIDAVISDNRYGLYQNNIPSILITHQLYLRAGILSVTSDLLIKKLISNFSEVWVPDLAGELNLSGQLSHKKNEKNIKFIGSLSRFKKSHTKDELKYEAAAIVSGPEPQRALFFEKILNEFSKTEKPCIIFSGLPDEEHPITKKNITILPHASTKQFEETLSKTKHIVCRSGYSSVMDMVALNRKAILVPTPGQVEQEYLADYLMKTNQFYSESQKDFNLESAITKYESYSPDFPQNSLELKPFLQSWLNSF